MREQPFYVHRIGHDEATDIESVRGGEVFCSTGYNAALDLWLAKHQRDFSEHDWFDVVVMTEAGTHQTFTVNMEVRPVARLAEHQCLDG